MTKDRGKFLDSELAPLVTATVHPSSILRVDDGDERRLARFDLAADLAGVAERV